MLFKPRENLKKSHILIFRYIMCFYRIIGLTFGGVDIKEGEVVFSRFWHQFGRFSSFVATLVNLSSPLIIFMSRKDAQVGKHYPFIFYSFLFTCSLSSIQVALNVCFLQRHGFEILKNSEVWQMKSNLVWL